MAEPPARAAEVRDELLRRYSFLREGVLPAATLFGAAPDDPDLYPDDRPRRGYLLPVPPPPGYKLGSRFGPRLLGVADGRPVDVGLTVPRPEQTNLIPTLWVHSAVRLTPTGAEPARARPWGGVTAWPIGAESGFGWVGRHNPAGHLGAQLARGASARLGRAPAPSARSPSGTDLLVEAFSEPVAAFLRSTGFLAAYHDWEDRCGPSIGRSGPIKPVLRIDAHDVWLTNGIGSSVSPEQVAATVGELLGQLAALEEQALGTDPRSVPWRTLTVQEPMLSLPDTRYAYPCPKCGKLEWLHRVRDVKARLRRFESLGCGAELFPPESVGQGPSS